MKKALLIVTLGNRLHTATKFQQVISEFGCIIRTRIGLHDEIKGRCSNQGVIILELIGEKNKQKTLARKITALVGAKVKLVEIPF